MSTDHLCSMELRGLSNKSRPVMTSFGVIYRRHGEPEEETVQIFSASELPRLAKRTSNGSTWYTDRTSTREVFRVFILKTALLTRLPLELVDMICAHIRFKSRGLFFTTDPLREHNGPFLPVDTTFLEGNSVSRPRDFRSLEAPLVPNRERSLLDVNKDQN